MNKYLFAFAAAAVAALPAMSDVTTVKTLYSGEPKDVTWANTLFIQAENFTDEIKVGDYIYITFSKTTDVIEIKSDGQLLPGSRFTSLGDNTPDYKAYITEGMLSTLKATGLEICGASFTVTGVSICNDGFQMPEGAIWGGYFWIDDNNNTLEIARTSFRNYENQGYLEICLTEDATTTGYEFNVFVNKNKENTFWAQNGQIKHYDDIAEVDLNSDVVNNFKNDEAANYLSIQGTRGTSNSFNIKAVGLSSQDVATGVTIVSDEVDHVDVYNLQGVRLRADVASDAATAGLPAGLYLVGGKKVLVK